MATSLIHFEAKLPNADAGTNAQIAVQNFINSLNSLTTSFEYQTNRSSDGIDFINVYGNITSAQSATALGYLNTLNAALGYNVDCITYNVTSQP